jgi:hypothetical protein
MRDLARAAQALFDLHDRESGFSPQDRDDSGLELTEHVSGAARARHETPLGDLRKSLHTPHIVFRDVEKCRQDH